MKKVKKVQLLIRHDNSRIDINVSILSASDPFSIELEISHNVVNNFIYGVKVQAKIYSK